MIAETAAGVKALLT